MSYNWEEFLALAEHLRNHVSDSFSRETCYRAGTSRAYYAAFNVARLQAEADGFISTEEGEDHKRLRQFYEHAGQIDIATALNRLRLWRNQADYDDDVTNGLLLITESCKRARGVILKLRPPAA